MLLIRAQSKCSPTILVRWNASSSNLANQSNEAAGTSVKEIDPTKQYTMFGEIRKEKKSVFHYSDRKVGPGFSHFSSTVYQHRPYIWPPLRKLYNFNYAIVIVGLLLISLDYDWILKQCTELGSAYSPSNVTPKEK